MKSNLGGNLHAGLDQEPKHCLQIQQAPILIRCTESDEEFQTRICPYSQLNLAPAGISLSVEHVNKDEETQGRHMLVTMRQSGMQCPEDQQKAGSADIHNFSHLVSPSKVT